MNPEVTCQLQIGILVCGFVSTAKYSIPLFFGSIFLAILENEVNSLLYLTVLQWAAGVKAYMSSSMDEQPRLAGSHVEEPKYDGEVGSFLHYHPPTTSSLTGYTLIQPAEWEEREQRSKKV